MRFHYESTQSGGGSTSHQGEMSEQALALARELNLPEAWSQASYQDGALLSGHIWSLTLGDSSWSGRDDYPPGFRRMLWALGVEPSLPCSGPLEAALLEYGLGIPPQLGPADLRGILELVARQPLYADSLRVSVLLSWLVERHPELEVEDELVRPWLSSQIGQPLLALAARSQALRPLVRTALEDGRWYPAARALALARDGAVLDFAAGRPEVVELVREHWPEALEELTQRCLGVIEGGGATAETLLALAECGRSDTRVREALRQAARQDPALLEGMVRGLSRLGAEPADAALLLEAVKQGQNPTPALRLLADCGLEPAHLVEIWLEYRDEPGFLPFLRDQLRQRPELQELAAAGLRGRPLDEVSLELAEICPERLVPELSRALKARAWRLRARAARAARGAGDETLLDILRGLAESDPVELVRCEATASLGAVASPGGGLHPAWWCAVQLGPLLASENRAVRRRAAEVLAQFQGQAAPARRELERAYAATSDQSFKASLRACLQALGSTSVRDWSVVYRDARLQIRADQDLLEVLDQDQTVLLSRAPDPEQWELFWNLVDLEWPLVSKYAGPLPERLLVLSRGGRSATVLTRNVGPAGFSEALELLFRLSGLQAAAP